MPSFVADDKKLGKGVVFGSRLKSRKEIELKLGYPAGPAPGGNGRERQRERAIAPGVATISLQLALPAQVISRCHHLPKRT